MDSEFPQTDNSASLIQPTQQERSLKRWRSAGLAVAFLGLGATIASHRFTHLKWHNPLTIKWAGPSATGLGLLLALVNHLKLPAAPKNKEPVDEIEESEEEGFDGYGTTVLTGKDPWRYLDTEDLYDLLPTTARDFIDRYGYDFSGVVQDPALRGDIKELYIMDNIDKAFDCLVKDEREALGIETKEDWGEIHKEHALLKVERGLMAWAEFRTIEGDKASEHCSKNSEIIRAVVDWLITLPYSQLIAADEYKTLKDEFDVGFYLNGDANHMTFSEFCKKHGWSSEIAGLLQKEQLEAYLKTKKNLE
jgi:hypothetical protein